jgi:hypothetical protein
LTAASRRAGLHEAPVGETRTCGGGENKIEALIWVCPLELKIFFSPGCRSWRCSKHGTQLQKTELHQLAEQDIEEKNTRDAFRVEGMSLSSIYGLHVSST